MFLEGISVKRVIQVTTQPRLGEIQLKCQQFCGWKGYVNIIFKMQFEYSVIPFLHHGAKMDVYLVRLVLFEDVVNGASCLASRRNRMSDSSNNNNGTES